MVVFSVLCFSYAQLLKYACVKLVVILEPSYFLPMSCILDNHHSFLSVVCFLYQGNISGQNEYVVYNAYRVVPEYVMEYSLQCDGRSVCLHRALSQYRARAASRAQRCNTVFPARTLQTPSLPSFNFAVPPTVTSTPTTATNFVAPVTPAVNDGACYLCTKDPSTCKCGLTSRKLCKYCRNKPHSCACPVFTTSSSKEIPYRCLTPLLQRWVILNESRLAVGRMQSSGVNKSHQPKPSKK